MINRKHWLNKLNEGWRKKPLVWLSGVRRSGKTTLCRMFPDAVYMNCDLPSVQRQLETPEFFFSNLSGETTVLFDEIHRLQDPSAVLKIGTDEFPHLKILATGSSTLEATTKKKQSLISHRFSESISSDIFKQIPGNDYRFFSVVIFRSISSRSLALINQRQTLFLKYFPANKQDCFLTQDRAQIHQNLLIIRTGYLLFRDLPGAIDSFLNEFTSQIIN